MRRATSLRLCVLAAFGVLVFALPVLAAGDAGHGAHGEPKAPGGLDFTGIKRWDLGIYTLVVFMILLAVLYKFAWPNIKTGLEKREGKIRTALDQIKLDRAETETRLADARKQLAEAAVQAKSILDDARKDADALKVTEREAGVRDAQAERERARRETAAEKETMQKEVQQQAVELAVLIASKALRQQVSIENQNDLLDASIKELQANASRA